MAHYRWARRGDVNAFFGLMLDNVTVMITLFTVLTIDGDFTPGFVLTRMIPGTALGVLIGDLVFTWMAFRVARRTGRDDVTAMPLGLDTPSTFGIAFLVLLPAVGEGMKKFAGDRETAMQFAWHVGLATLVFSGVFKLICAPFGNAVRRLVPRAGLLGSLAAIALALIAFLPMLLDGIAAAPVVGILTLAVILVTLVAHIELPGRFPGALAAVLVGVVVFLIGRALESWYGVPVAPGLKTAEPQPWQPLAMLSFYQHDVAWWGDVLATAVNKLPLALPFALATIVGGIDCTESAAAAGDEYDTSTVLFTEAGASLVAGLLGGVIQTTPYIGHPAYKRMGGRAAYTLATALFVGAVGYFGGFQFLFAVLPTAAMYPILVFVGLEITAQSFHATPQRHYPALALAMLPALAYLSLTVVKSLFVPLVPGNPLGLERLQTLRCLANGFLISGLLWAAALAMILDRKLRAASLYFGIAAVCTLFGIIHSPLPDEKIDLPWRVLALFAEAPLDAFAEAVRYQTPYHWAAAYALTALGLFGLSFAPIPRLQEHPPLELSPKHPEGIVSR
jgi:AGZA family xanthine/uracil permease-like MFS transporter